MLQLQSGSKTQAGFLSTLQAQATNTWRKDLAGHTLLHLIEGKAKQAEVEFNTVRSQSLIISQQPQGRNNLRAKLYELHIDLNHVMLLQGLHQNKTLVIRRMVVEKSGGLEMHITDLNGLNESCILISSHHPLTQSHSQPNHLGVSLG